MLNSQKQVRNLKKNRKRPETGHKEDWMANTILQENKNMKRVRGGIGKKKLNRSQTKTVKNTFDREILFFPFIISFFNFPIFASLSLNILFFMCLHRI